MKYVVWMVLLAVQFGTAQTPSYLEEIKKHRQELNKHFKDKKSSPLPKKKIKNFIGLPFFPVDEKYKVKAKMTYTFNAPIQYIANTDGKTEAYQQYAVATFKIDDKQCTLYIYQSLNLMKQKGFENYLFIPFSDNSNGKSTYGSGRYLDTTIPAEPTGYITLDFNKAYNPYCAYNEKYVCPIPPKNNHLDLEIRAGVKYK
ncbi:DUF1684 domain-containing protein [Ochrovirga pacifica]|uniref:DUF1684 domain-containing protein n=1 Tax=Ochrovirga pacifica TaxID=1042376 RepID=UPI0002559FE1|nr:DUF1684 domain-containing protein [Ochrovirga pacifica]